MIIKEGTLDHAYVSVQFAIEELGKIVMLKEAFDSGKSDPILVEDSIFRSHEGKPEKAFTVLDPKVKTIHNGIWKNEIWDRRFWNTVTPVSHKTRLDCAFVDYNGTWHIGRRIDKDLLVTLINHIGEKLPHV